MPRILLIDDDPNLRTVICRSLVQAGYEVSEASDGKCGLALHQACPADLIITDIVMPETEGLEVLMALKNWLSKAKVLVISGGGLGGACDYLRTAQLLGADAVLAKPFTVEELLAAVARLMTRAVAEPRPANSGDAA